MDQNNLIPAASNDLLTSAIQYVRLGKGLENKTETVVGLVLPRGGEADKRVDQVRHIVDLLARYHADKTVERPLSIVVFGPPGSGKSTFVKEITANVPGCRLVLPPTNLTQIAGTGELAQIFENAQSPPSQDPQPPAGVVETPVFFFDEFDAALDGVPLGWLSWFLAPMQDGVVQVRGKGLMVRKAAFIFAGGTAETLDEFNQRARLNPEAYRARKVPDFVSRLRGTIDIGGVNGLGDARIVPRALVLRRLLLKRAGKTASEQIADEQIADDRIKQLLLNGHFVHGVRSMDTLLDATWSNANGLDLPEAILRQHFSRGNLDGQLVGISAGLKEASSASILTALTTQLLRSGASLAYGGAFEPQGTLEQVLTADREAPQDLVGGTDRPQRVHNYLGYPASLDQRINTNSVKFIELPTLSRCELKELGAPMNGKFDAIPKYPTEAYDPRRHVAWALSLFRLRVRLLQDVSALVVLGGKDDGQSWGRVAGIAEEVMIAVALRKPVFVLGGAGGAARAVGQLLGLDEMPVSIDRCLRPTAHAQLDNALAPHESCFEIPGVPGSPRNLAELRRFLFHRGVTTAAWPWNGLSMSENRELFACRISGEGEKVERAVALIMQGLSRIDWKPAESGRGPVRGGGPLD